MYTVNTNFPKGLLNEFDVPWDYGDNGTALEWSTDPPTEPGWYWVVGFISEYIGNDKFIYPPHIVYVERSGNNFEIYDREDNRIIKDGWYWLGPLPVPEAPTE